MQRSLLEVRRRLVELMRDDPPFRLAQGSGSEVLDPWMATRLTEEDLQLLHRLEELHGEEALADLFADALLESGALRAYCRS